MTGSMPLTGRASQPTIRSRSLRYMPCILRCVWSYRRSRFGQANAWTPPRAQLADLAVEAGRLDEARDLLDSSLASTGYADFHAVTLSFWLVASARLAMVDGDPRRAALALGAADGLRCRAGLRVWPTQQRGEAELLSRVEQALDPARFEQAFAAGTQLNRREAVALVRGEVLAPSTDVPPRPPEPLPARPGVGDPREDARIRHK